MIFVKKKRMMEVFPLRWRNLWTEWQLRGLILLSLTNQIILIILGNRRKYTAGTWIKLIVWSAYLLADSIATMAIGTILNGLGDVYNHDGILDAKHELTTFWAPILLLHLGGTDTITAYSLEDNELWTRHLLEVVFQAIAILYIWLTVGTTSHVSLLFILMFVVGLVKYCERVWVLYKASDKKFRDSIPDIQINSSKITDECLLKEEQGYHLTTHQVLEVNLPGHLSNKSLENNIPGAYELLTAYSLLEMVKRLFADLILGFQDRDASKEIFEKLSARKAFRIIEIELGFIFDMFYTKAKSIYSPLGIAVRIIGIFVNLIVLLLFLTLGEKHRHSKIDINITLVLLGVALLLDFCAFRELLLSDQTALWLIKHKKTTCLKIISALRLNKKRRWSNSVSQFSLLRFSLRNKLLPHYGILKMFRIEKMVEIQPYDITKLYVDDIKCLIFCEIKQVNSYGTDLKTLFGHKVGRTLKEFGLPDLVAWSGSLGFDQSILIWHLATEICYFQGYIRPKEIDAPANKETGEREPKDAISEKGLLRQRCNYLSRYMLYLLVKHPNMLPIGMGNIKFHNIYAGIGDFIEKEDKLVEDKLEHASKTDELDEDTLEHASTDELDEATPEHGSKTDELDEATPEHGSKTDEDIKVLRDASKTLSKVASEFMIAVDERDISNFVMFHASRIASKLEGKEEKWEIIKKVWLQMLCHAAGQCKGRLHAHQLRRGGELLTHAWLLMAHFGLTDHFQIPSSPAIAEAMLR